MECRERGRDGKTAPRLLAHATGRKGLVENGGVWNRSGGEGRRNSVLDMGVEDAYLVC